MEDFSTMKTSIKILCLVLSLLMLVACFAACGDSEETTLPKAEGTENESGRNEIKDSLPADLKFNGEKMVFFVRNQTEVYKNEMDVDKTTNNTLNDAVYYRNAAVEERLGVTIEQVGQDGGPGAYTTWNATLRNAVLTKSGDFDSAAIHSSQGSALAVEGLYYNVLDLPHIDLTKPWWNNTIADEMTLFDTLYYLAGDICVSETASGICFFFNKDLFDKLYQTQNINLYDLVNAQKWTIDQMHELVANAWIDEDSDGVVSENDIVGYAEGDPSCNDGWVPAMGIKVTTMVDGYPELTFYDEHTVEAFEKVKNLHDGNPGYLAGRDFAFEKFISGKQLFVKQVFSGGETLRAMSDSYGVLPFPKFDEEQDDYHSLVNVFASLVVVLSTCNEPEKVGATLELMAAESYKQVTPAYFEVCLQGKYSDAPEDAEMYDRIIKSFVFNFGQTYSTKSLGSVGGLFRDLSKDIAQTYEANKVKYETALEDLVNKLDDISFMMG